MKIEITTTSGEMLTINVSDNGVTYTGKPLAGGAAATPEAEEATLDAISESYLALIRAQARASREDMRETASWLIVEAVELVMA